MSRKIIGFLKMTLPRTALWQVALGIVCTFAHVELATAATERVNLGTFGPSSTAYDVPKYNSITSTNREDVFTFTVTGKATGTVTLSSLTNDLDLYLSNGQKSDHAGKANESISFTGSFALPPGTYSVTVKPWGSAVSGYALRLNFTVAATEMNFEGGTNPKGFFTKTIGTDATGTVHWVHFTIVGTQRVPIRLSGMTINVDMELKYGSKTGEIKGYGYNRGTATEDIVVTLSPGEYYLKIYRVDSSGSTSYRNEIQTGGVIR